MELFSAVACRYLQRLCKPLVAVQALCSHASVARAPLCRHVFPLRYAWVHWCVMKTFFFSAHTAMVVILIVVHFLSLSARRVPLHEAEWLW